MSETTKSAQPGKASELAGAFELFVEASQALEQQYAALSRKVEDLSADLVQANDRLNVLLNALPAAVVLIENEHISHFNQAAAQLIPGLQTGTPWHTPSDWKPGHGPDEFHLNTPSGTLTLQAQRVQDGSRSVIQIQDITANLRTLEESERVDRLGFFTSVDVDSQDVPGTADQVDLTVTVAEKPTGNLQIGAGFSSSDKLSLMAGVRQENIFGTGNYLGLEINTSKTNRQLVISTVDPYFTADGVSRGFDLYSRTNKPQIGEATQYTLKTQGGSIRFGVPFTESDTVFFGAGAESWDVEAGNNISLQEFVRQQGSARSTSFPLSVGWQRDQRDSALVPTRGTYQRANGDWGVGGDIKYLRAVYQLQRYIPLNKQFTVGLNGELGWGQGTGNKAYPVIKNFYSGGLGSVRGFEQGSLGPRYVDPVTNLPTVTSTGGAKKITLNAELLAPFPGAGNDRTLRMFGFVDAGNVFAEKDTYKLDDLKASTGLGVSWISPVGPLRLAFAFPLRKEASDRIQRMQFQIGTAF